MKIIKKIICSLFALGILAAPIVEARRYRVKSHFRHYKSGKVVRVRSHIRKTKKDKWFTK